MSRSPMAPRRASGGGRPVTKLHIAVAATLLVGIFVIAPLLVWLDGRLDERRTLVDVSASPRLAQAEAALRDLDACRVEYDRPGLKTGKGSRHLDVLFLKPCESNGLQRHRAPGGWKAVGQTSAPFRLERDSRGAAWRVYALAAPDELAKVLEEASPALHGKPMRPGEY